MISHVAAEFTVVGQTRSSIGESPTWSPDEGALYWVDIVEPAIYRLKAATGAVESWRMPDLVGSIAVRRRGGLLVALRGRLAGFDPSSGSLETLIRLEQDRPENRCNDGRCDRAGRFWVGTMHHERRGEAAGSLYCFDAAHRLRRVIEGVEVPNGLAWSRDGATMYFADTFRRQIETYAFDTKTGEIGARRVFAEFKDGPSRPDGSAVDAEGYLWSAVYGGACLHRYAPEGRLDRVLPLPVTQPTSCAFGGADLAVLYVTSASRGLAPSALSTETLAGAVLAFDVHVTGFPETPFAG